MHSMQTYLIPSQECLPNYMHEAADARSELFRIIFTPHWTSVPEAGVGFSIPFALKLTQRLSKTLIFSVSADSLVCIFFLYPDSEIF